jgi:Protein of unknown function (DUF2742)
VSRDEWALGAPEKEWPQRVSKPPRPDQKSAEATTDRPQTTAVSPRCSSSQQVSWWPVHEIAAPVLAQVQSWPMAGTPEWCALDDDDPAKWAALLDAAQHWALRVETLQEAHCDASREISAALDWSALAREINERTEFYAARPWLKRVVA